MIKIIQRQMFLEVKRQNLKGYHWCHWEEKLGCVSIYHGRNGVHDKMQHEMIFMTWELSLKAIYLFEFAVSCSSYPTLF